MAHSHQILAGTADHRGRCTDRLARRRLVLYLFSLTTGKCLNLRSSEILLDNGTMPNHTTDRSTFDAVRLEREKSPVAA